MFARVHKSSDVIKLRDFQYRLLLNKVFTNDVLYKWKIKDNVNCELCNENIKQTIMHLIVYCNKAAAIWNWLQSTCNNYEYNWSTPNIIFNNVHPNAKNIVNLLTLIAKQYIFREKCLNNPPTIQGLRHNIRFHYYRENQLYNSEKLNKRWLPVTLSNLNLEKV